ncbi:MAG: serine/threonine-protein kinase [Myxococcota bacterium]
MANTLTIDSLILATVDLESDFVERTRQTIGLPLPAHSTAGEAAVGALKELDDTGQLSVLGTLGVGGMAIVRLAHQASLGRDIALKTLRPERATEQTGLLLLREAWVTGHLEHPNIVPVHDVRFDEEGRPMILLKRIEGRSWGELLREENPGDPIYEGRDPLLFHLRVLIGVCNAIEFAHSRNVIHRDIKPDNVMIGAFGEITVLDWGIAASLTPDPSGRLATVQRKGIAGTPAYMAPEMVAGDILTEKTDVYLLGAVLFEILTGRPPHRGQSLNAIVRSISRLAELPQATPPMLALLCQAAMAPDPDERLESAAALRGQIEDFLEHQGVEAIISAAEISRKKLADAIAAGAEESTIIEHFSSGQFGFRHAHQVWPEHPRPPKGLDECLEMVTHWAIQRGALDIAAAYLAQMRSPPPALQADLEAARAAQSAQQQEIDQLLAANDVQAGRTTRTLGLLGIGSLGMFAGIGLHLTKLRPGPQTVLPLSMSVLLILGGLFFYSRRWLGPNGQYTNRVVRMALAVPFGDLLLGSGAMLRGVRPDEIGGFIFMVGSVVLYCISVTLEPYMIVASISMAITWIVTAFVPHLIFLLLGVNAMLVSALILAADRRDAASQARQLARTRT